MVRKRGGSGDKKYCYYICSGHKAKSGCKPHSIREDALFDGVLAAMQGHIRAVADIDRMMEVIRSLPEQQGNVVNYDAQIVRLNEEIERSQGFKMRLYDNLQDGLIDKDEYFLFKKTYTDKIEDAERAIQRLEQEREDAVSRNASEQTWTEVFLKYRNMTELDRKAVVDLIEEIRVFECKRIDVRFRYASEFDKVGRVVQSLPEDIRQDVV